MFICNTCLEKGYTNAPGLSRSVGRCEQCGEHKECSDIPSKYLQPIPRTKPLFMQDDCAPDSLEYFEKKFKERFRYTIKEFQSLATREVLNGGMTIVWSARIIDYENGGVNIDIELSYSGDSPWYEVEQILRPKIGSLKMNK